MYDTSVKLAGFPTVVFEMFFHDDGKSTARKVPEIIFSKKTDIKISSCVLESCFINAKGLHGKISLISDLR